MRVRVRVRVRVCVCACVRVRVCASYEPASVAGTGPYMSPEMLAALPLRPACDVWSLSALLYEVLLVLTAKGAPVRRDKSLIRASVAAGMRALSQDSTLTREN